jgi:hypothetical protein
MPYELVDRLFNEFKEDPVRWEEFERRGLTYLSEGIEEPPGRAEIIEEFVRDKLGPDHGYTVATLIIKVRKTIGEATRKRLV